MGDIGWMKELARHESEILRDDKAVLMPREVFERIDDYTRSQPTSPSPGRCYRKNFGWPDHMDDNWFFYECVPDAEPGYVLHVPYQVLFLEEAAA